MGQWIALIAVVAVLIVYGFIDTTPRGHRNAFWLSVVALIIALLTQG